jgi:hypothetical protein
MLYQHITVLTPGITVSCSSVLSRVVSRLNSDSVFPRGFDSGLNNNITLERFWLPMA